MNPKDSQGEDIPHFLYFIALTLFAPATIATILVYIVLRGLHSLTFRNRENDHSAKRARMACAYISVGVGMIVELALIAVIVTDWFLGRSSLL
jgi:hypothetical protein